MPFEIKLMHINPLPLNIQISRFSVFCLAHFWSRFQEIFDIFTSTHLTFVVKADMALMAIWLSVTVTWRVSDTWKEPGSARRHVF